MESGWLAFSGHQTQPRLCCKPKQLSIRIELWDCLKLGRQYTGYPRNLYSCLFFLIMRLFGVGNWLVACEHVKLSLVPRTYVEEQKNWCDNMHVVLVLGRWRQVDLWTSLASQPSLYEEIQDNLDCISKEDRQIVAEEQQLVFSNTTPHSCVPHTQTCMPTHASIYIGTHVNITHKYKHMHLYCHTHKHACTCASKWAHSWTFIHIETHIASTLAQMNICLHKRMHSEIFFWKNNIGRPFLALTGKKKKKPPQNSLLLMEFSQ